MIKFDCATMRLSEMKIFQGSPMLYRDTRHDATNEKVRTNFLETLNKNQYPRRIGSATDCLATAPMDGGSHSKWLPTGHRNRRPADQSGTCQLWTKQLTSRKRPFAENDKQICKTNLVTTDGRR
jgi:hypothetical protein